MFGSFCAGGGPRAARGPFCIERGPVGAARPFVPFVDAALPSFPLTSAFVAATSFSRFSSASRSRSFFERNFGFAAASSAAFFFASNSSILSGCVFYLAPHPSLRFLKFGWRSFSVSNCPLVGGGGGGGGGRSELGGGGGGRSSEGGGGGGIISDGGGGGGGISILFWVNRCCGDVQSSQAQMLPRTCEARAWTIVKSSTSPL